MAKLLYQCVDCDGVYDGNPGTCSCGCVTFTTRDTDDLFDADELGLDPEEDDER